MPGILAKLTSPRIDNVYHRNRLYKHLDAASQSSVIWITSPAGSGKTTLVSSYLKKKNIKPIWYQIDEGDTDIASFFSYLGLGYRQNIATAKKLPLLTLEYSAGITAFSRNYFREFFDEIKTPGFVVFDNFQEVSTKSKLHQVLKIGFKEIPQSVTVIIISRENPPQEYLRLQASGSISHIIWDDIKLELKETKAIVKLRSGSKNVMKPDYSMLHKQSQGWLTGLVLLLENAGSSELKSTINDKDSQQRIFDYFAGEIMSKTKADIKHLLFTTALLPKISAKNAVSLSQLPDAESILIDLTQRNYFTVRHSGVVSTYEYHPLFRKFLIEEGLAFFDSNTLSLLRIQAADLLEESGYTSDAIRLFQASEQWQKSIQLILKHAKEIVYQGHGKTLLSWIEKLPDELINSIPWLTFWKGMCHIAVNPKITRGYLDEAFYAFKNENNINGQLITFCSIVDTYIYERAEMQTLDKWLEEVSELISIDDDFVFDELGMRLTCAMFMALIYRQPGHSELPVWEKRACEIVLSNADSRLRINIGNHLVLYYMWWIQDKTKAEIIVKALQPIIEKGDASPLARITWQMIEAGYHWMVTGSAEAVESAQKGLDLGGELGIHILDVYILTHAVFSSLFRHDYDAVELYLNKMTPLIEQHRYMDTSWYYLLTARAKIAGQDYESAFHYAELALEHSLKSGRPFMIAHAYVVYANVVYEKHGKIKALEYIDKALELGLGMNFPVIIHLAEFARMEFEINEHGEQVDVVILKKCLAIGKKSGSLSISWFPKTSMAKFYSLALKYNLESEYVQECIQKSGLLPLDNNLALHDWPYPIKIYTLGVFKILIDGAPLIFKGKAQKKVLELLKILIAHGSTDVSVELLCETLWPDADGDSAYQSFSMTLQRLRKLIVHKEVLILSEGKLSLDTTHAWVDICVFEKGLSKPDEQDQESVLSLYSGAFLKNEPDSVWVLPIRERLKRKFMRRLKLLAEYYTHKNDLSSACKFYEWGIESDPLAEDCYQFLMQCYLMQEQPAKALTLYKNYRLILQQQLGIKPGKELQKLYSSLEQPI